MLAVYKHFMLTKLSKPGQKYLHKSDYIPSLQQELAQQRDSEE